MNVDHAIKSARRFHKTATLLGSFVMGFNHPIPIEQRKISLPFMIQNEQKHNELSCFYISGPFKGDDDYINSYIVNAAFSLELHFKVLCYLEHKKPVGSVHNLEKLFKSLSLSSQNRVEKYVKDKLENSPQMQEVVNFLDKKEKITLELNPIYLLKKSSEAFINWRYAYEGKTGYFIGYSEFQEILDILIKEHSGIAVV